MATANSTEAQIRSHCGDYGNELPTGAHTIGFVDGSEVQLAGTIGPEDIVRVDFSRKYIDRDGLYLINTVDGWRGCRRFQITLGGIKIDQTGTGNWVAFESDSCSVQIVGRVTNLYKGTRVF